MNRKLKKSVLFAMKCCIQFQRNRRNFSLNNYETAYAYELCSSLDSRNSYNRETNFAIKQPPRQEIREINQNENGSMVNSLLPYAYNSSLFLSLNNVSGLYINMTQSSIKIIYLYRMNHLK